MGRRYERRAPLQTAGVQIVASVPADVRVVGDWIEWHGTKKLIDLSRETAALDRFIEIKTGEDAAAFVRRYGDLSLQPKSVPNGKGEEWREPVAVYVQLAARLRELLEAASSLQGGRTASRWELRTIGVVCGSGGAPLPGLHEFGVLLGFQVSRLAAEAGLQPSVMWRMGRFEMGFTPSMDADAVRAFDAGHRQVKTRWTGGEGTVDYDAPRPSTLWGYLVSCVVRFVVGGDMLYTCTRCGRLHSRERAPRSGGAAYCPDCREAVGTERVRLCRARARAGAPG
ncbi:MAG: hypothetical protein FJX72_07730 [Armatimonadetes bacterium]|nr:hypothetical protein [Armatimonadota bacterium]